MHLNDLLIKELDAFRERTGRQELQILETGSIRNEGEQYHQNDGWSTLTFAQYVAKHGGRLTSIDLDVSAADAVLKRHEVRDHVKLVRGYSIDALAEYLETPDAVRPSFDVVLLDSENDATLTMAEYLLARRLMNHPALLLADDVEPDSAIVVKGKQLVPHLDAQQQPWRLETRIGDGYSTGVLIAQIGGGDD